MGGAVIECEYVLRRCVANDGAPCPDILGRASRGRGDIGTLKLIAAEINLLCRSRSGVRIDDALMGIGQGGDFWFRIRPPEVDITHILHEYGAPDRCRSRVGNGIPVQIRCSPAHNIQHGICLIERACEVEAHLAEVRDVAHGGIRVDVECVIRYNITGGAARSAAIEHSIRERGRIQRAVTLANIDDIARRLARALSIAAVDFRIAAEGATLNVDNIACGITCRHGERRIGTDNPTIKLAVRVQRAALDIDSVVLCIGILRRIDQLRMIRIHGIGKEVNASRVASHANCDIAARKVQRIILRAAVLLSCKTCIRSRMTAARDIQLVVIRCIAVDGQSRNRRPVRSCSTVRCHIDAVSCILEAVAVDRENRCTDCARAGRIRPFAELVISTCTDECGRIVIERHYRSVI